MKSYLEKKNTYSSVNYKQKKPSQSSAMCRFGKVQISNQEKAEKILLVSIQNQLKPGLALLPINHVQHPYTQIF